MTSSSTMTSAQIRRTFLDHFVEAGHLEVPSASLVPSSYDPSVLLNTAGMQPMMPYFLGRDDPPGPRLASCQKCFRTVDIDGVGATARHCTFFEMLGNFSFGDYFKAGAVDLAWDLVTNKLGLDPALLWATVHEGDAALGLGLDQEAIDLWLGVGVPRERIVALGADNFWKAGATGPCGPSSELFYDRGEAFWCGDAACAPGCECDRYLEFYNLVFMQYERDASGGLTPLPNQNIDTGMGLERISCIMQGVESVYEIDSFQRLIGWAEEVSGTRMDADAATTKAFRILCDHGRGMVFLASDGVMPSNEGRGYVLRRIIRRAIVQADRLGLYEGGKSGVLSKVHEIFVAEFGEHHANLVEQRGAVATILAAEEERFLRTLDKGSALLGEVLSAATTSGAAQVEGDVAFQLHDTFGFPVELTEELAGERGLVVDRAKFDALMQEQRERARAAAGSSSSVPAEVAAAFARGAAPSTFVGFDELEVETTITALQQVEEGADGVRRVLVKLERSPFYAEGGGQVADAGTITGEQGRATIETVLRFDSDQVVVAHLDGTLSTGETVAAAVDPAHRMPTQSNHTATHLLHAALRDVLGDHVKQAGSLVEPGRLRFDFSHTQAITPEQMREVERIVTEHIASGEQVSWEEVDIETARERGATMLFGEKYGDRVRMVSVGDGSWSLELCGGTHVSNTAQIRGVLVTGESSVGSNTRRIEALTGEGAERWLRTRAEAADRAARTLGVEVDALADRCAELQRANRRLEKELSALRSGGALDAALATRSDVGAFAVVTYRDDTLDGDELLELADSVKGKLGDHAVVVLGSGAGGRVALVVSVADAAVNAGAHAGNIIKAVAGVVGGGGGGRPNMARAGGKDVGKLDEALAAGRSAVAHVAGGGSAG